MPKPSQDLHLDFETYCDLDLKKVGIYRYVEHPSFKVLSIATKIAGRPTLTTTQPWLRTQMANPDVQGHAWNAAFETAVLKQLGITPAHPLSCTMQRALAYGLPGRLEAAAAALGVAAQKNMAGHRLMLKMTKPLKPGAPPWELADYLELDGYCRDDVEAEAAVSEVIPELPPDEAELSRLDALMNTSGALGIDAMRVNTLAAVAADAEKADAARCKALTSGAVTSPGTQTDRLMKWLAANECMLPDLARATVEEALAVSREEGLSAKVVEVLEIRLRMARASTRKLERMIAMSDAQTGALKGQFQFNGAGRTGRWSGRGVQVQNLPRVPKGFAPERFYDLALASVMYSNLTRQFDVIAPAPILDCVSWSLRSCLKATMPGLVLWSFDFSQIEARVLAWLAGQGDILQVFASGADVYVWAAAQFGSQDRQLGKVLVLALGFGMGATKLRDTAFKSYGVKMTAAQAEKFKDGWRQSNHCIVHFWYAMEDAAKRAILQRGQVFAVGGSGVAFVCTSRTLQMRLPSGRVLYYHRARIDRDTGSIVYWGPEVGGRWVEQRTWGGKLAENATQAAARDVMSEAMLRLWRRGGWVPVMTVHDELVYTLGHLSVFTGMPEHLKAMALEAPPWAGGLPLAGESKVMTRYSIVDSAPNTVANDGGKSKMAAPAAV